MLAPHVVVFDDDEAIRIPLVSSELDYGQFEKLGSYAGEPGNRQGV
jgi:hypothetical protein